MTTQNNKNDIHCRRLWQAILVTAIRDLTYTPPDNVDGLSKSGIKAINQKIIFREDARQWFLDENDVNETSFVNVCKILGIDPRKIVEVLAEKGLL